MTLISIASTKDGAFVRGDRILVRLDGAAGAGIEAVQAKRGGAVIGGLVVDEGRGR